MFVLSHMPHACNSEEREFLAEQMATSPAVPDDPPSIPVNENSMDEECQRTRLLLQHPRQVSRLRSNAVCSPPPPDVLNQGVDSEGHECMHDISERLARSYPRNSDAEKKLLRRRSIGAIGALCSTDSSAKLIDNKKHRKSAPGTKKPSKKFSVTKISSGKSTSAGSAFQCSGKTRTAASPSHRAHSPVPAPRKGSGGKSSESSSSGSKTEGRKVYLNPKSWSRKAILRIKQGRNDGEEESETESS